MTRIKIEKVEISISKGSPAKKLALLLTIIGIVVGVLQLIKH